MNFYNIIEKLCKDNKIVLFVDMDGVIAAYNFGEPLNFKNKRPLNNNISIFNKINSLSNVELHILSVCRENYQIEDKNNWLDKFAPFFDKDKRHILSKEMYPHKTSSELKLDFLKQYKVDKKMVLIDDDIRVLRLVRDNIDDIYLYQDSELVD